MKTIQDSINRFFEIQEPKERTECEVCDWWNTVIDIPTFKTAPEFIVVQLGNEDPRHDQKISKVELQPAVRFYSEGRGRPGTMYIMEGTVKNGGDW